VTHHAAVVFAPALDRSTVRHVELVRLATGRAMIVLVADTGRVENHMLAVPEETSDAELDALAARLNQIAVGSPLESVAGLVEKDLGSLPEHVRGVASDIVRTLRAEHDSREAERVFLEGASNIVDEQNFHGPMFNRRLLCPCRRMPPLSFFTKCSAASRRGRDDLPAPPR
jgi:heat-inducible transcriptional repressor